MRTTITLIALLALPGLAPGQVPEQSLEASGRPPAPHAPQDPGGARVAGFEDNRAPVGRIEDVAGFEDYRDPAGRTENGVLRITLEARAAAWRPWGEDGPAILAHVFAADGEAPRVPAPLIRVRAGTPVHVTVRNTFERELVVRGLLRGSVPRPPAGPGPPPRPDSVVVGPDSAADVRFTPTIAGTYVYTGQVGPLTGGEPRPDIRPAGRPGAHASLRSADPRGRDLRLPLDTGPAGRAGAQNRDHLRPGRTGVPT